MNKNVQMQQHYFDSDESTIGMFISWSAAMIMNILQWLNMETISSTLVFATTVMAAIFTVLKIRGQRLQNKKTELDIEITRRKLNEDDENN
jgi:hypothetical protein